jgi:hypothetical protein
LHRKAVVFTQTWSRICRTQRSVATQIIRMTSATRARIDAPTTLRERIATLASSKLDDIDAALRFALGSKPEDSVILNVAPVFQRA